MLKSGRVSGVLNTHALPAGKFDLLEITNEPGSESTLSVYRDGNWTRIPFIHYAQCGGLLPAWFDGSELHLM